MTFLTPSRIGQPAAIIASVAAAYGFAPELLRKSGRSRPLAHCRHLAAYMLCEAGLSTVEAGKALGARHHTTVMHSLEVIRRAMGRDRELRALVARLRPESTGPASRYKPERSGGQSGGQ